MFESDPLYPGADASIPLPPPPRRVYRRRGTPLYLRIILTCLVPHVWAGVALLYVSLVPIVLSVAGRHVAAKITLLDTVNSKGTHYRVKYTYPVGRPAHTDSRNIKLAEWRQLKVGQTLGVREINFLGIQHSRIDDPRISEGGLSSCCLLPFALLWNGIMCGLVVTWIGPAWTRKRLAKLGLPAVGRLTMKRCDIDSKKNRTYKLGYAFMTSSGLPIVGVMAVTEKEFSDMSDGQIVPVLYDASRPRRNMIYGLGEYAAADDRGDELVFDYRT